MTSLPMPTQYDAAASYRNFGQELLRMIQSGEITPERANQLKANVYEATRLGNTAQGQQAMNAAIGAARDALPMKGYDPAAMYRNIGSQLSNAISSGKMTVQQAQALQAPLFEAVKLGNTAPGYAQMNSAYNRAIDAIRNTSPAQPQGGLTLAQAPKPAMPEIVTLPSQPPIPPQPPMPVMPPPEREVIGQRSPIPGVHGGDTRIFADQPMAQPHVIDNRMGPNFGKPMQPEGPQGLMGIGGMLSKFAEQFRNAESMPKSYTSAPRQLTQEEILGITSMPQRPQGVGMAPQMPQGMTLSNVPRQLTLSNVPMQSAAPQPMSAPQGMALGGLLRKYYGGGMC